MFMIAKVRAVSYFGRRRGASAASLVMMFAVVCHDTES
jgi:hypothetical protein